MATIASLLVRIGADTSDLHAALRRSASDINNFAKGIGTNRTAFKSFFGNLPIALKASEQQAKVSAARMIADQNRIYAKGLTDLKLRLSRNKITGKEFIAGQRDLASAFDKALQPAIDRARATGGKIADRLVGGMVARLKSTPVDPNILNNKLASVADISSSAGRTLTAGLTVPIVGFALAAAKAAGDFEANFNRVRAVTKGSADEIGQLRQAAIDLGQTTKFGPAEVAEGFAILGQAGLEATSSLKAMTPVIQLATIENTNLDDATKILIHTMAQFGVTSNEMGDKAQAFADKMAVASLSGTVNIKELGSALNFAGSIANQTSQDFDFVLASLTKLAQAGQAGTVGGTAFRNILAGLAAPSIQAQNALQKLAKATGQVEISFTDSKGKFRPLIDILHQLGNTTINVADLFRIFRVRSAGGLAALRQVGVKDILALQAALENASGSAKRISDIQFSGLNAQLTILKHSFEALAISIGDTGLLSGLTTLVVQLSNFTRSIGQVQPGTIRAAAAIGAFLAAIGPTLSIIGGLIRGFVQLRVASVLLAGEGGLAGLGAVLTPAGVVIVGLTLLGILLAKAAGKAIELQLALGKFTNALTAVPNDVLLSSADAIDKTITSINKKIADSQALAKKGFTLGELKTGKVKILAPDEIDRLKGFVSVLEGQRNALRGVADQNKTTAETQKKIDEDSKKLWDELLERMKKAQAEALKIQQNLTPKGVKALTQSVRETSATLGELTNRFQGLQDRDAKLAQPIADANVELAKAREILDTITLNKIALPPNLVAGLANAIKALQHATDRATSPDPTAFSGLTQEVDDLLARMEEVRDTTSDINAQAALMAPFIAQAASLEDQVTAAIKTQGGEQSANLSLLRARNRLLRQLPPPSPLKVAGLEAFENSARTLAENFARVRREAEQAVTPAQFDRAKEHLKALNDQLASFKERFVAAAEGLGVTADAANAAWEQLIAIISQGGGNILNPFEQITQDIDDMFNGLRGSVRAVFDLADAFGGVSEEMAKLLQGTDQLLAGLQQVSASIDRSTGKFNVLQGLPGIIGAAAGAVSVVSSVVGGDPELKALQTENNARLRELTDALKAQTESLARNAKVGNISGAVIDAIKTIGLLRVSNDTKIKEINRILESTGLSFADLEDAAKSLGISLVDSKGHLRLSQLDELGKAAQLAGEKLRLFSTTLEGQANIAAAKASLSGGGTPGRDLEDQLNILTNAVGPKIRALIGNIDLSTREGKTKLRNALLGLVQAIQNGQLKPEDFGDFKSADELLAFLTSLGDSMNTLDQSTKDVTDSLNRFSTDIQTRLNVQSLKDKLTGKAGPESDALNQAKVLSDAVGPKINQILGSIDTTTAEGRAALRTSLLNLVNAIQAGQIPLEQFGDFANADDLLAFLNTFTDSLAALDDATNSATKSMANVPAGFKIALRRFQATAIEVAKPSVLPREPTATQKPIIDTKNPDQEATLKNMVDILRTGSPDVVASVETLQATLLAAFQGLKAPDSGTAVPPAADTAPVVASVESLHDIMITVFQALKNTPTIPDTGTTEPIQTALTNALRGLQGDSGEEIVTSVTTLNNTLTSFLQGLKAGESAPVPPGIAPPVLATIKEPPVAPTVERAASVVSSVETLQDALLGAFRELTAAIAPPAVPAPPASAPSPDIVTVSLETFQSTLISLLRGLKAPEGAPGAESAATGRLGAAPGDLAPFNQAIIDVTVAIRGMIDGLASFTPPAPAPTSGAAPGKDAPTLEAALRQIIDAFGRAGTDVAPEIKNMINVITQVTATEAANSIRGLQDVIVKSSNSNPDLSPVVATRSSRDTTPVTFNFGGVTIQGADKTAREQWQDVKKVARREANAKFGDGRRWGEVP